MNQIYSIFLFCLCCYHTVCASVDYGRVSATTTGEPCLNTCENGLCAVDYHLNTQPCIVYDDASVPIYFTSMVKGHHSRCLSNCAKFGYSYEWCFTTEDYDWDYCSSGVKSGHDVRTLRGSMQSWLNLFSSSHRSKRALDRIFSPTECSDACKIRVRHRSDGHTQGLINGIYSSGVNVDNVTLDQNSPYTFVATRNSTNSKGKLVYLPVIVKATLRQLPTPVPRQPGDITREARKNVQDMYNGVTTGIDVGHIIAFQNGGTRDLFNYVGQTSALNKGPYKVIENTINDWINFGGTAQLTVVVVYSGTKPTEFAVKLKLYDPDGSLHSDLQDMILLNI